MRTITLFFITLSAGYSSLCHAQMTTLHLPLEEQQTTDLSYNYGIKYEYKKPEFNKEYATYAYSTNFYTTIGSAMFIKGIAYAFIPLAIYSSYRADSGLPFLLLSFWSISAVNILSGLKTIWYSPNKEYSSKEKSWKNYLFTTMLILEGVFTTAISITAFNFQGLKSPVTIISGLSGLIGLIGGYAVYTIPF